ncbi:MAG: MFS transporter [Candidatus Bathyarchaeota archaeon]|nr:MFS transporter [Candidatus Bathyarchaeota archaeon]
MNRKDTSRIVMMTKGSKGINLRTTAGAIFVVANAFIWYFYAFNWLVGTMDSAALTSSESILVWGVNLLGISISAFAATLIKLRSRTKFLLYWILLGAVISTMPLMINTTAFMDIILVAVVFGVYFGFGMPICMGYYAAVTKTNNRSRIGGITFLMIGLGFFALGNLGVTQLELDVLILIIWRVAGFLIFLPLKTQFTKNEQKEKHPSYLTIISNRPFLLYFVPWLMLSLVNYIATPVITNLFGSTGTDFVRSFSIIESILMGVFAVVGGFLADRFGRKRLAIIAFATLGIGYAVLGMFPYATLSWYTYTVLDGVSWGFLYTLFLITIWGDLAQNQKSEKFYAIGSLPFLFANFMRFFVGSYISGPTTGSEIFPLASFFLFIAVLPLVYAPETLPEKVMKSRDLQSYVEKAKSKAHKEREKMQKEKTKEAPEEEPATDEEGENGEEYDEAQRLAEKYY